MVIFHLPRISLPDDSVGKHLFRILLVVVILSVGFVSYLLLFKSKSEFIPPDADTKPMEATESLSSDPNSQHQPLPQKLQPGPGAAWAENELLLLESFRSMLLANEYESVVDAYDQIYTNSSTALSSVYRELLLDHVSDLIQDNASDRAILLLNQYLAMFYADVDALIFLGRAYRNTGSKFDAIKSFQSAHQHEHRTAVSALILGQENTLIGEYVQDLKENNDQQGLVDLYQWLTQSQPNISGYYIGLASAYIAQDRYNEAMQTLRYVQYDMEVGQQARSLLRELTEQ